MSASHQLADEVRAARRDLGLDTGEKDVVVALAGNPNTGKSTVFNALTGLRQHTGNWPGKTVTRAEGQFEHRDRRHRLIDLPGTYSLLAMSPDEEAARDFILFGRPDVTVVVVDAGRLERNLNLVLQVAEITDRLVVCLNLVDEAERHGIEIDAERLADELGVPVVATAATSRRGPDEPAESVFVARVSNPCLGAKTATHSNGLKTRSTNRPTSCPPPPPPGRSLRAFPERVVPPHSLTDSGQDADFSNPGPTGEINRHQPIPPGHPKPGNESPWRREGHHGRQQTHHIGSVRSGGRPGGVR